MTDMYKDFDAWNCEKAYSALKQQCESQSVTWRWATQEMYNLQPFFSQKNQFPLGRWTAENNRVVQNKYLHGLDEQGNIQVIREFRQFPSKVATREVFFRYLQPDLMESLRFEEILTNDGWTIELVNLERLRRCDGIPASYESLARHGHLKCLYQRAGNELTYESCIHESKEPPGKVTRYGYRFTYDPVGRLQEITHVDHDVQGQPTAGAGQLVFRRAQRGETVKELATVVRVHLEREIPIVLAKAGIADKVYCLLLVYDAENDPLPPSLALGREEDRKAIVQRSGTKAKFYLWNPAENMIFNRPELELSGSPLDESCRMMNQLIAQKGALKPAVDVLDNVCGTLAKSQWDGILDVTDDFVVATVDLEGAVSVKKSLKKTASPECLLKLVSDGLV